MKFYKDATGFWFNGELTPQGFHTLQIDADNATISRFRDNYTIYNGLISDILKENGTGYTSKADFLSAVGDFFVDATQLLEVRVAELENQRSLFIDYYQSTTPATPAEGEIWYDTANKDLSVYENNGWVLIPLSVDSIYLKLATNEQYRWNGSDMVALTVPLTKTTIEDLVYSAAQAVTATTIDLSLGEVFTKTLTGATTFTITNPRNYKAFRLKLSGGSLNTPIFSGYTETFIASTLRGDYVSTGSVLYCEIQSANVINLFWGE
jgi:hypothetical protein